MRRPQPPLELDEGPEALAPQFQRVLLVRVGLARDARRE